MDGSPHYAPAGTPPRRLHVHSRLIHSPITSSSTSPGTRAPLPTLCQRQHSRTTHVRGSWGSSLLSFNPPTSRCSHAALFQTRYLQTINIDVTTTKRSMSASPGSPLAASKSALVLIRSTSVSRSTHTCMRYLPLSIRRQRASTSTSTHGRGPGLVARLRSVHPRRTHARARLALPYASILATFRR